MGKQQNQVQNHAAHPRQLELPLLAPVVVKNYSQQEPGWLPAFVEKQTGPVSYQCCLDNGNLVKRHIDQIHPREEGPLEKTQEIPPETKIVEPELPQVPVLDASAETDSSASSGQISAAPRRSARIKKSVEKLNLCDV